MEEQHLKHKDEYCSGQDSGNLAEAEIVFFILMLENFV